jgi:tRNA threonylcarbamoyladenosine biosynthesis protein TsaB
MPRALALETSGRTGSVALAEDGAVLREEQFSHGLRHAAGIVPIIDRLCRGQGWSPADVEEVYVSAGPGSFTGLRVGVTVAKTLAFATGARVVAVPTAEVLARNAPAGWQNVVIVLDAKRDQIFTATFVNDGTGRPVPREGARLDSLAAVLSRVARPVHLVGEGIPCHQQFVPADDPGVVITPPELWQARAAAVAEIGYAMARWGEFTEADRLAPIYVRKPEAEEKYDEKHAAPAGPAHPGAPPPSHL